MSNKGNKVTYRGGRFPSHTKGVMLHHGNPPRIMKPSHDAGYNPLAAKGELRDIFRYVRYY